MRTALTILLIFSLICQCTVQLGVMAWYEMNKDYIASNLCENRNKPQMGCNGKCQLAKQLRKADSGHDNTSGKHLPYKNHKAELADLLIPERITLRFHPVLSGRVYNPTVPHFFSDAPAFTLLQPPPVTA